MEPVNNNDILFSFRGSGIVSFSLVISPLGSSVALVESRIPSSLEDPEYQAFIQEFLLGGEDLRAEKKISTFFTPHT